MSRFYPGGLMKGLTHGAVASNIDLLSLSPLMLIDMKRATTAINADGTGGAATAGNPTLWVSDRSGNSRPLSHVNGNAPTLRTDATLLQQYLEFVAANAHLLSSPAFTRADPFVIMLIARQRVWADGKYLLCSRGNYQSAMLQSGSTSQVGLYDGGASAVALQSATTGAWHLHVGQYNGDGTTTNQVDNNTPTTGDAGAGGILGGLNLGGGPDANPTGLNSDTDVGLLGVFPALSAPQLAAGRKSAGADWGIPL